MKKLVCVLLSVVLLVASLCVYSTATSSSLCDINADSDFNAKDILLLRQYLADWDVAIDAFAADLNHDSKVNGVDLLLLRKVYANIITIDSLTTTAAPTTQSESTDPLGSNLKTVGNTLSSPISGDNYTLKWIDDFDSGELNADDWTCSRKNANQAEESVNRVENVVVENGMLNLYAKKEDVEYTGDADPWNTPKKSNLTSGFVSTQGKRTYQYGRLEIKCKIPYSLGMWAAFWTMGTERGWPWGGEVDIMEFVGGQRWSNNRDGEYGSNLHWCDPALSSDLAWSTSNNVTNSSPDEAWNSLETKLTWGSQFNLPEGQKLNDKWHICGVEWTDKTMSFYCDDKVYSTVDITKASMREAFHQPHYIILNIVMGGSWAGTPDETTVFPQTLSVDWIKLWQK